MRKSDLERIIARLRKDLEWSEYASQFRSYFSLLSFFTTSNFPPDPDNTCSFDIYEHACLICGEVDTWRSSFAETCSGECEKRHNAFFDDLARRRPYNVYCQVCDEYGHYWKGCKPN